MRVLCVISCLLALAACGGGSPQNTTDGASETAADTTADTAADTAAGDSAPADAGNDAGTACDAIAGTWSLSGTCPAASCTVVQSGCTVNFSCLSGLVTFSGTIAGHTLSYTSPAVGTCTGTISGSSVSGSCTRPGSSCTFAGTKQ